MPCYSLFSKAPPCNGMCLCGVRNSPTTHSQDVCARGVSCTSRTHTKYIAARARPSGFMMVAQFRMALAALSELKDGSTRKLRSTGPTSMRSTRQPVRTRGDGSMR